MVEIEKMPTEQANPRSAHVDTMSVMEMVELINSEDAMVIEAVSREKEHIAAAIEKIYGQLHAGGRLIYAGAGTSGRLGVLDAVECPPTYSTDPAMVQGLIAGGETAVFRAVEGAEDNEELGALDLQKIDFDKKDVLVGIAASGRTPYVLGAMRYAGACGAFVIGVTCSPDSLIDRAADIGIAPYPGPEVVTGSTRLKCGTAEKMVLNMLTTCTMIKMGKVYGNLMVDVRPTNEKLMYRCVSIICTATGCSPEEAKEALEKSGNHAKTAIVMILCDCDAVNADKRLKIADGHIYGAVRIQGR